MFKIIISIGLLACYSLAKSVDLPNDQVDLPIKDADDSEVPDLSEVIREVENIQETFLRKLSEEMKKIDGKLQKIRDRHDVEMKHFGQEPKHEVPSPAGGEKMTPEADSNLPTDSDGLSEEDLRRGGKQVEPKVTEAPQMSEENLPKETPEVREPEKVIIEVRVPVLPELTKPEEKEPIEEPQPDLGGVKEFGEDFSSTTPKSLEEIIEKVKEELEKVEPEDKKLPKMESEEQKGEQESAEKLEPVEEEKMDVSSSESTESSEEKSDLITAPSGASIIISVPVELQGEEKVHIEVIPGEGQEYLNPQPEDLRLAENNTEAPVAELTTESLKQEMATEIPVEETTTKVPREETPKEETPREETTTQEEKSSTEGVVLLPPGNTVIVSLSTGPPQLEKNKEIVIDIEIPKGPAVDENIPSKTLPTEGRLPEATTERPCPTKTTRRPTEGKKRPSGKRCPIGYQFNIYTLECTIQANYATGFGSYYWSMSQPPSSLTQNNPFMNLFGLRK